MALSKSKKRKKRKIEKRKNLKIMNPEFIKANQCWIPDTIKKEFKHKRKAWFNIKASNSKTEANTKRISSETEMLRTQRINLFPTSEQKEKLLKWLEIYRRVYNITVSHRTKFIKKGFMASYENVMRSFIQEDIKKNHKQLYRDIYQLDLIETDKIKRKHYTIPLHSLWNAINDVKKAYVSAKANKDAGNIKSFRLRYKKASKPERTFVLEPGQFSSKMNGFAVTPLGEMKSSELFGEVTHECRIAYSSITKKFVLCKPCDILTKTTLTKSNLIALDPGMRTFQNGYSPDGICYKFANTGNKKLNRIKGIKLTDKEIAKRTKENIKIRKKNNIIKHLITRIENVKKKSGHNYKKFLRRIRAKLTNMITDLHWKTANFLCRNFNTILVGKMSTTEIVKKERSVLRPLDKKLCIQLSHYKFRERLLSKAEEFGVKCLIVDESYTTQTCGKCGTRNLKVGGAKVFKCINEDCTFKYDRDYNAARNIYLKALSQKTI